jgi:hypothetical protein
MRVDGPECLGHGPNGRRMWPLVAASPAMSGVQQKATHLARMNAIYQASSLSRPVRCEHTASSQVDLPRSWEQSRTDAASRCRCSAANGQCVPQAVFSRGLLLLGLATACHGTRCTPITMSNSGLTCWCVRASSSPVNSARKILQPTNTTPTPSFHSKSNPTLRIARPPRTGSNLAD